MEELNNEIASINDENNNENNKSNRERELLDIVFVLESEKQNIIEESRKRLSNLRQELEDKQLENERLQKKVQQLELAVKQSMILSGGNVSNGNSNSGLIEQNKMRQDQEEMLLKAKTLLFEKAKVNKQQEQQIEVLKQQILAIKDVAQVTKDMLNLKTAECEHMQERLDKSQAWIKAEQSKCLITEKKLAASKSVYEKLKAEYDIQTKIFKELKETYEEKIKVLTTTINKLKE